MLILPAHVARSLRCSLLHLQPHCIDRAYLDEDTYAYVHDQQYSCLEWLLKLSQMYILPLWLHHIAVLQYVPQRIDKFLKVEVESYKSAGYLAGYLKTDRRNVNKWLPRVLA